MKKGSPLKGNQQFKLSRVVENLLDKICPPSMDKIDQTGCGTDNMTCILVQIKPL